MTTNSNGASRRRLSDILHGGAESLRARWEQTEAAPEYSPVPAGTYQALARRGELVNAQTGTPGYRITFEVIEGDHAGRMLRHDLWLSEAAIPMTKRDLAKLGIASLEQLEQPMPQGIRCAVRVVLRRDDDGIEFNRVHSFAVVSVDPDASVDPDFAPEPPASDAPRPDVGAPDEGSGTAANQDEPTCDTQPDPAHLVVGSDDDCP